MSCNTDEQKRIEFWYLNAARRAGVPIPFGEIPGEKPDFRAKTETGTLGIEVTEAMRPASSNHGIVPVYEEAVHNEILKVAQRAYYAVPNARPIHVGVTFTYARGKGCDKSKRARALTEFVHANANEASPCATFWREEDELPDGFDFIRIIADSNPLDWWTGEGGGVTVSDVRLELGARIAAKDKLVPIYRSNLPNGAGVWLLLYTGVTVARSMPIPHGIEEWRFPFRFDRVFWFVELEGRFVEIHKADLSETVAV